MESTCIRNAVQQLEPKRQFRRRPVSLDDGDNISDNSRFSLASSMNSDSETGPPMSVRDMIKHYNSVGAEGCCSKFTPTKRSAQNSGVNKFGSQSNARQFVTRNGGDENDKSSQVDCCCSKKFECCNRHLNGGDNNRYSLEDQRTISHNELKGVASLKTITSKEKVCPEINVSNCQPIESSYQSKTTIAKTGSGVRIIIDIFFDQEQTVSPNEVVGSRVETDIPQSRILSEFQQQALTMSGSQLVLK